MPEAKRMDSVAARDRHISRAHKRGTSPRKVVIVANRLPITVRDGRAQRSPGGLVSALRSVVTTGSHWVGWAGCPSAGADLDHCDGVNLHSIELSQDDLEDYYDGFANSVLWPLFHGRLQQPQFNSAWWDTYVEVNRRFATTTAERSPLGGCVWVHDYHLLLVPQMLRAMRPDLRIGLFLHIPFPAQQIFDILPWRAEIIRGTMGADLVGFQTPSDAEHFRAAVRRHREFGSNDRFPVIDAFPISVDFHQWNALGAAASTAALGKRRELNARQVLLGVDRLDYTKGIAKRVEAFGELLDEGQLNADDCVFVQVAVPSRGTVDAYCDERAEVEAVVDAVNHRHPRTDGSPVVKYLYNSLDPSELAMWYRTADVMLVTPLADGMNLVAKEFVAARSDLDGALVLSEFAGAAHELAEGAELVNPYDCQGLKNAVMQCLNASASTRRRNMLSMRSVVADNDVNRWANGFLDRLDEIPARQAFINRRPLVAQVHRPDAIARHQSVGS